VRQVILGINIPDLPRGDDTLMEIPEGLRALTEIVALKGGWGVRGSHQVQYIRYSHWNMSLWGVNVIKVLI
jgi:hypothetical protein